MDEKKLSGLFQDAVGDAPPASFDEQDIVRTSHRVTVRRRMAAAGGSVLGVAVLTGGLVWGGLLPGFDGPGPAGQLAQEESGEEDPRTPSVMVQPLPGADSSAPDTGAEPPISRVEPAFQQGCGEADPMLAGLLAQELPAVADETPRPADLDCLPGARGVSVEVQDDSGIGVLSIVLAPEPAGSPTAAELPTDGVNASISTADGELLTVTVEPGQGSADAPHADEIGELLARIADRL
ncbi:hypothetical protein FHR81_003678 [Actinoalloteichus hoggarensis]|uniref:Uncharacterized protein n=1 Tax=Actinoalloteichus hoggarensis TaxID=1470176 RepID=A0A221WBR8_9PSEU|nr:hypothetical protein [Actinoalloteichus hoggarensis]ASO23016.1 hypothetical protein AHOG_27090 [Actinoalloteichus hoggarensis]MBB5922621.1 hypothetical protein [Actinoalloteichus hoggarensis]